MNPRRKGKVGKKKGGEKKRRRPSQTEESSYLPFPHLGRGGGHELRKEEGKRGKNPFVHGLPPSPPGSRDKGGGSLRVGRETRKGEKKKKKGKNALLHRYTLFQ